MLLLCGTSCSMRGVAADSDDANNSTPDEVIVVTARQPRRIADEPTRIEVIDREELEEKVSMSPGNVSMLLNETSGLRVQLTSPGLGATNVRIQGLRGHYSQILADGLPLYGGQTGSIGLLQIPPIDLGQVEALKGVASALYGASALGGVINFISRRPDGAHELLLNQTSQSESDAALWWSGPSNQAGWSYSVLASANRQTAQDVNGDGWADLPRFDRGLVRPRLYWSNGEGSDLLVTAGAMVEDRSGGTIGNGRVPVGDPNGSTFVEALKTQRYDAGLAGHWRVGDARAVAVRASYTERDLEQTFGDVHEPIRLTTALVETSLDGTSGRHNWVVGAAFQQDQFRDDTFPAFDFAYDVPALFAQDELPLGESVTMSISGRVDHHNVYGTFFSPRVALLWGPGGRGSPWRVRASVGTGLFAPTPLTEETEATGLARVLPLRSLDAEKGKGVSLDVNRVWGLEHGSVETNLTLFGSRVSNAVHLIQVSSVPPLFEFENAPEPTRNAGSELLLRWRTRPVTLTFTHAYLNSTEFPADALARRTVPLNPAHASTFTVSWERAGVGRVGFESYYTGRQSLIGTDNPYAAESPTFTTFGLLLQRQFGPVNVSLNCENLTDQRLTRVHPLVLPARAADGSWTTDAWGPLDGRVINVGARWRFGSARQESEGVESR
jgi:iron complex outermembrane receptor protein